MTSTIAELRKRHPVTASDLFVRVLGLRWSAGLVQLAHLAMDGAKKANASYGKTVSNRCHEPRAA